MNRQIDYKALLANVDEMITLLEFDAMRSAGKTKLNSQHIHSLYVMKDLYEKKCAKTQDAKATRSKVKAVAEETMTPPRDV